LLKESGFRPREALSLTYDDIDFVQKTVTMNNPLKGSLPRRFKASDKLLEMLRILMKKQSPKDSTEKIWKTKQAYMKVNYLKTRKRVAQRFGNPNLRKISWRTFRHFKATMTYHDTKDILYTQHVLGHKCIESTMFYTHLIEDLKSEDYTVRVAETLEDCTKLLEAGFEYVTDYQDKKLFRKRK